MKYLVLISLAFFSSGLYSQNEKVSKMYYKWFDDIVGVSNTNLYNGVDYKENYRTLDGNNQYFLMQQFVPGVVTYGGQPYYEVPMKYDVHGDHLIIKLKDITSGQFTIQLIKKLVESFQIEGHKFINSNSLGSKFENSSANGFYEVLFKNSDFLVLKKHIKNMQQRRNDRFEYNEFISRTKFFIYYQHHLFSITSKKSFFKLFSEQKNAINSFYSKNRPLMRSNYDIFLTKLMAYLNVILTGNTK